MMLKFRPLKSTRRRFLLNTGMLAAGWELFCADSVLTQELAATPFCRDGDEPTVRETDPPPLKWSDLRYVFDSQEGHDGKEALQG